MRTVYSSSSTERIQELEKGLHKAISVTDHLEKRLQDTERHSEAKVWDLKERLDYANTAKQR